MAESLPVLESRRADSSPLAFEFEGQASWFSGGRGVSWWQSELSLRLARRSGARAEVASDLQVAWQDGDRSATHACGRAQGRKGDRRVSRLSAAGPGVGGGQGKDRRPRLAEETVPPLEEQWRAPSSRKSRAIHCPCGQQAHDRKLRTKTVLTAAGADEVSRPYYLCPYCHEGQAAWATCRRRTTPSVQPVRNNACRLRCPQRQDQRTGRGHQRD